MTLFLFVPSGRQERSLAPDEFRQLTVRFEREQLSTEAYKAELRKHKETADPTTKALIARRFHTLERYRSAG